MSSTGFEVLTLGSQVTMHDDVGAMEQFSPQNVKGRETTGCLGRDVYSEEKQQAVCGVAFHPA